MTGLLFLPSCLIIAGVLFVLRSTFVQTEVLQFDSLGCSWNVRASCKKKKKRKEKKKRKKKKRAIIAVHPTLQTRPRSAHRLNGKMRHWVSTCLRGGISEHSGGGFGRWFVPDRATAGPLSANLGQFTSLSTSWFRAKSPSHPSLSHYWSLLSS